MSAWRPEAAACARVPSAAPQLPNLQDQVSQMWQRHSSKETSLPLTNKAILYNTPFNWLERTARAANTPAMPPLHPGLPAARTCANQPEPAAHLCTDTAPHLLRRCNIVREETL